MALSNVAERTTSTDHIFDTLYERIVSLDLLPGTKISETEVAKSLGYSRQPVREAFTRLANLNLLLIRPQRATLVRPFSLELIADARFMRLAIELEVVRQAAARRDPEAVKKLKSSIKAQRDAVHAGNTQAFHDLDYEFHKLMCAAAGRPAAFQIISENKAQVDRLCMLSLTSPETMETLFSDHVALFEALMDHDASGAEEVLRQHLSRLDPVIDAIYTTHRAYFDH